MKNQNTPLFKAFSHFNKKALDFADAFGNLSVSRYTVALVMAAVFTASGQNAFHGKQGFRELADSITAPPIRQPVSLTRGIPLRELKPK